MATLIATECLVDMYDRVFLEGGFTAFLDANPPKRYAVSATHEQTYVTAYHAETFDVFRQLVQQTAESHPEATAIGGWLDNGRIYVEPVETYNSRATAEEFGRTRNQVAIYDLTDGQEITL